MKSSTSSTQISSKIEVPKIEIPKIEIPKIEIPKIEIPKIEIIPKSEVRVEKKVEIPKVEVPKIEIPKIEIPKIEIPKREIKIAEPPKPKAEIPKIEIPKIEIPKIEIPKGPTKLDVKIEKIPPVKIDRGTSGGVEYLDVDEDAALDLTYLMYKDIPSVFVGGEIAGKIAPDEDTMKRFAKRLAKSCKVRGWSIEKYYAEYYIDVVEIAVLGGGMYRGMLADYKKLKLEENKDVDKIKKLKELEKERKEIEDVKKSIGPGQLSEVEKKKVVEEEIVSKVKQ